MKCPKCGYLGFETGDRCRNCGYDFSLTPPPVDTDLTLNQPNPAERVSPPLDLDRLFGAEPEPASATAGVALPPSLPTAAPPSPQPVREMLESAALMAVAAPVSQDASELPFDEGALVRPPKPARPPLGVRRTTPDLPRTRPRSNRPIRFELSTDSQVESPVAAVEAVEADPTLAPLSPTPSMEPASLPVRLGALLIDSVLLGAVSVGVLVLTLRIANLSLSWTDIRILPPIPFVGFLALLSLGYGASFTVAGGQTIGKMLTGARVIGDDGRPVDVAGAVLRALGCALVPLTLGLSYGPVILTSDRRALHDRLAGTRVVRA
jgi:uncharacterized RDD family membrane protein YckC